MAVPVTYEPTLRVRGACASSDVDRADVDGADLDGADVDGADSGGIDFDVHPGDVAALIGPDPADPARVADLVFGLGPRRGGTVTVLGGTPAAAIRAGRLGAVSRRAGLMPEARVEEMLRIVRDRAPRPLAVEDVVRRSGIAGLLRHKAESLSTGERERVRFALAIATDPGLLVLEDPGTGGEAGELAGLIRAEAAAGRAVLVITSRFADAVPADRFLVVVGGRLAADRTSAELVAAARTRSLTFHAAGTSSDALRELTGVRRAANADDLYTVDSVDVSATIAALHAAGITPKGLAVGDRDRRAGYLDLVDELVGAAQEGTGSCGR